MRCAAWVWRTQEAAVLVHARCPARIRWRRQPTAEASMCGKDVVMTQTGKVLLVTGASSGIGERRPCAWPPTATGCAWGRASPTGWRSWPVRADREDRTSAVCVGGDPVDDAYRRQMNRQLTCSSPATSSPATWPRQARQHPPGVPGRDGGPARRARPGPHRHRAPDDEVPRRRRAQLRAEGHELRDEDIAHLSPLKHRNLNLLGRYSFTARVPAAGAQRAPDTLELDEDDDGSCQE
uniref:Transposase Tn3 family protein n=1 Tax=Streptomyces pratensis (strain ATCC 33331 / IAF-45CD) TaxID=591167 RepID=A0A8D3WM52_STRFA